MIVIVASTLARDVPGGRRRVSTQSLLIERQSQQAVPKGRTGRPAQVIGNNNFMIQLQSPNPC
jgi:hypothetical protein